MRAVPVPFSELCQRIDGESMFSESERETLKKASRTLVNLGAVVMLVYDHSEAFLCWDHGFKLANNTVSVFKTWLEAQNYQTKQVNREALFNQIDVTELNRWWRELITDEDKHRNISWTIITPKPMPPLFRTTEAFCSADLTQRR